MEVTRSRYERFLEGQTVYILDTLQESTDGSTWAAKDLSASTVKVRFRAQRLPAGTGSSSWLIDAEMTKVTAASGIVGYYATFDDAYGAVECLIVLVDEAVVNAVTTTGYRERVWKRWSAVVDQAVRAA